MGAITKWPALKVGLGPALTKREAGARLGIGLDAIENAIRRTRIGKARTPFPDCDGYAVPDDATSQRMLPYWYERTVIAYGKAAGNLDSAGKVIKKEAATV